MLYCTVMKYLIAVAVSAGVLCAHCSRRGQILLSGERARARLHLPLRKTHSFRRLYFASNQDVYFYINCYDFIEYTEASVRKGNAFIVICVKMFQSCIFRTLDHKRRHYKSIFWENR